MFQKAVKTAAKLNRHMSPDERFWVRVRKTDSCWLWTGHVDKDGYGRIKVNDKAIGAHRYSYMIHKGKISDGLLICHTCDNPSCVNPSHLYAGTTIDNMNDRGARGRAATGDKNASRKYPGIRALGSQHHWAKGKEECRVGEKNGRAKLNRESVEKIKKMFATGNYRKTELGRIFGVTETVIRNVVTGKSWVS